MSKFNTPTRRVITSPVVTLPAAAGVTNEGAPGFARDPRSELFLLAVSHLDGGSFYEPAPERDARFQALVHQVAATDSTWMVKFVPWLRDAAGMRTASVVAAAETARAFLAIGRPGGRQVIADSLKRADEPGELLAYWTSRYGRNVPKPVKRGLADAADRLYTQYSLLKYDTASHGFRFGDVIELAHPSGGAPADLAERLPAEELEAMTAEDTATYISRFEERQGALYAYALDRRHNRDKPVQEVLRMVRANAELRKRAAEDPSVLLDSGALKAAGMTWEDALSLAGPRVSKKELWTALIPQLGYFALVRNLRNIDQAGVSDDVAAAAVARIADPEQVRKSRLFPFRFLAAYQAAPSLRWGHALEQALNASLSNVPALDGRTLILVARSGSMFGTVSEKSGLNRADTAALFGTALALRAEYADLVEFGTYSQAVPLQRAESVLRAVGRFSAMGGTNTADAVRRHYRDGFHTRVVIVTDEQAAGGYALAAVPERVPVYTWNLAGYQLGHAPSGTGNRHTFGGLTDHSFGLIPMLEAGHSADWDTLFNA